MLNDVSINSINSIPPLLSLRSPSDDRVEKVHIHLQNELSVQDETKKIAASSFSKSQTENSSSLSSYKVSVGSRFESKLRNLFSQVKAVVLFHLIVNPAINKHISQQLANVNPKHYETNYLNLALSYKEFFRTLKEKYSSVTLFSNKILRENFEHKLINQVNRELKKNKLPLILKEEIRKVHYECSLIFLEDSTFTELKDQIEAIPSNKMPIDLLGKIELNEENREFLLSTWKRIIVDLSRIGELDKLQSPYLKNSASIRIECAIKLLEVLKFAPKSVDSILDEEIAKYSDDTYKLALVNFIVHESSMINKRLDSKYSNLIEKQNVYHLVTKELEAELKNDFYDIEGLTETKIRRMTTKLYYLIPESQQHLVSKKDLRENLIKEVEAYALNIRGFIPLQIEKLRKEREESKEIEKGNVFLFKTMEEIDELDQKYQQFAEERFKGDESGLKKGFDTFIKVASENLQKKLNSNFSDMDALFECFYKIKTKKYGSRTSFVISQVYSKIVSDHLKNKVNIMNSGLDHDALVKEVRSIILIRDTLQEMEILEDFKKEINVNMNSFNDQITNPESTKLLSYSLESLNAILKSKIVFGKDVEESIKNSNYLHPSKISTEALIVLMKFSKVNFLLENDCQIKESEKLDLLNSFKSSNNIPNLLESLEKFIEKDEGKKIGNFLTRVLKKINPTQPKNYKLPLGISEEALDILYNHIKVQQTFQDSLKHLSKGQDLLKKYQLNPNKINPSDRLNLQELGAIFKLAEFEEQLEFYKKLGVEEDPLVKNFASTIQSAIEIKKGIEEILLPVFGRYYNSGDIFAYYGKRKKEWGTILQKCDKGAEFFCDGKTHGMKVYREGQELRGSEIAKDYLNTKMRIYDVAISDVWRLNIKSLIPKASVDVLKDVFGNNWSQILQEKYEEIEKEIHGKKSINYSEIENDSNRRILAGLADWKLLLNSIAAILPFKIKGHTKKHDQNFNRIYHTFMSGEQVKEEQICSEFVSKTTLIAVMELNKFVANAIAEKKPNLIISNVHKNLMEKGAKIPKNVLHYLNEGAKFGKDRMKTKKAEYDLMKILKKYNYSSKTRELILRLNNKEIINLPYDKRERMNKIHPGRMVTVLEKKKCIVKLKKPKEFNALINSA